MAVPDRNYIYITCYVSPVTLPSCSLMDRHQAARDANTQTYEKICFPLQTWSVKILRFYVVTLLDQSKESSVNVGNTTVHHFSVKMLHVSMSCNCDSNKCFDSNTNEFQCDRNSVF